MGNKTLTSMENRILTRLKNFLNDFLGNHNVRLILYGSKATGLQSEGRNPK